METGFSFSGIGWWTVTLKTEYPYPIGSDTWTSRLLKARTHLVSKLIQFELVNASPGVKSGVSSLHLDISCINVTIKATVLPSAFG